MQMARAIFCVMSVISSISLAQLAATSPAEFGPTKVDPIIGDWQGPGGYVAQIASTSQGYQANVLRAFDTDEKPVAVLTGVQTGDSVTFTGEGWSGTINRS